MRKKYLEKHLENLLMFECLHCILIRRYDNVQESGVLSQGTVPMASYHNSEACLWIHSRTDSKIIRKGESCYAFFH